METASSKTDTPVTIKFISYNGSTQKISLDDLQNLVKVSGSSKQETSKTGFDAANQDGLVVDVSSLFSATPKDGVVTASSPTDVISKEPVVKRQRTARKPGMYKCDLCKKTFSKDNYLKQHQLSHSEYANAKPVKCDICDKRFQWPHQLRRHMFVHGGDKKPHECDICGKGFLYVNSLNVHMRFHRGERPFKCDECGDSFQTANTLTRHLARHQDVRPFQCKKCDKGFNQSYLLKKHMETHDAYKPELICDNCNKSFKRLPNYKGHIKRCGKVSSELELPDVICENCNRLYKMGEDYERHQSRCGKEVVNSKQTTNVGTGNMKIVCHQIANKQLMHTDNRETPGSNVDTENADIASEVPRIISIDPIQMFDVSGVEDAPQYEVFATEEETNLPTEDAQSQPDSSPQTVLAYMLPSSDSSESYQIISNIESTIDGDNEIQMLEDYAVKTEPHEEQQAFVFYGVELVEMQDGSKMGEPSVSLQTESIDCREVELSDTVQQTPSDSQIDDHGKIIRTSFVISDASQTTQKLTKDVQSDKNVRESVDGVSRSKHEMIIKPMVDNEGALNVPTSGNIDKPENNTEMNEEPDNSTIIEIREVESDNSLNSADIYQNSVFSANAAYILPNLNDSSQTEVDVSQSYVISSSNVVDISPSIEDSSHKAVDISHSIVDSSRTAVDLSPSFGNTSRSAVDISTTIVDSFHSAVEISHNIIDSCENAVDTMPSFVNSSQNAVDISPLLVDSSQNTVETSANVQDSGKTDMSTVKNVAQSEVTGNCVYKSNTIVSHRPIVASPSIDECEEEVYTEDDEDDDDYEVVEVIYE